MDYRPACQSQQWKEAPGAGQIFGKQGVKPQAAFGKPILGGMRNECAL